MVFAGALIAGSLPVAAFAGDEPVVIDAPEVQISTEANDGWYVRADVGYAPWLHEGEPDYLSAAGATVDFDETRFSESLSGSAGIGYQFNDMLRADVTADVFKSDLEGGSLDTAPCTGAAAGTSCAYDHDGRFRAAGLMANAYVDLGTLAGFTPYVGAGLGATKVRWDDITNIAANGGTTVSPGLSSWRFTYALMTGASYDFGNGVKLDVGYRFSEVGGGDMFGYGAAERAAGLSGVKGRDEGFQRHEFRAGIRIALW
ncbi:porin family protein [Rhizobium sp. TRM95111]|uniref:outer membrane protein n=1 Tax=Rhizobium alarense TaxID=2846851 RepID=UPI001F4595E8|nr:outer membrane protein [Rhizobium alarense]MCF3638380.1 porin family protein [Rhizobium alarense]